jgi:hypothetical protein
VPRLQRGSSTHLQGGAAFMCLKLLHCRAWHTPRRTHPSQSIGRFTPHIRPCPGLGGRPGGGGGRGPPGQPAGDHQQQVGRRGAGLHCNAPGAPDTASKRCWQSLGLPWLPKLPLRECHVQDYRIMFSCFPLIPWAIPLRSTPPSPAPALQQAVGALPGPGA